MTGFSDGNRGIIAGGVGPVNVMEYITIATNGDANDFGDLTAARRGEVQAADDVFWWGAVLWRWWSWRDAGDNG